MKQPLIAYLFDLITLTVNLDKSTRIRTKRSEINTVRMVNGLMLDFCLLMLDLASFFGLDHLDILAQEELIHLVEWFRHGGLDWWRCCSDGDSEAG